MKVWRNGNLIDFVVAELDVDGWPPGEGIFETLRTEGGKVFELGRHMRRAIDGASKQGISLPDEEDIRVGISAVVTAEPQSVGRLRLLFANGLFIVIHNMYEEISAPMNLDLMSENESALGISVKSYPYTHRLELLDRAISKGFGEVICCNANGFISEGAVSNFIFRIDGQWITTPLSAGVLPGVQRAIAVERCGVEVRNLARVDIPKIEAALVLSSLKLALPVAQIAGQMLQIDGDSQRLAQMIRANTQSHSVG
jgi:branched-chain amino acid aminotransferase